jgi:ABC-type uncharacterized transport system fused permease/ATPase subunit
MAVWNDSVAPGLGAGLSLAMAWTIESFLYVQKEFSASFSAKITRGLQARYVRDHMYYKLHHLDGRIKVAQGDAVILRSVIGCRWLPPLRDLHSCLAVIAVIACQNDSIAPGRIKDADQRLGEDVRQFGDNFTDLMIWGIRPMGIVVMYTAGLGRIVALYHLSSTSYQIY